MTNEGNKRELEMSELRERLKKREEELKEIKGSLNS